MTPLACTFCDRPGAVVVDRVASALSALLVWDPRGARARPRMCTTRAAARRLNAAAAASLACDVPPCDTGGPDTAALAAHSDYYDRAGDATPDEPVRRLSLPELATDPAVVVFALMHVVALLTPWLVGRPTWRSAALVFASYTARMFGAPPARPWRARCRLRGATSARWNTCPPLRARQRRQLGAR